MSLILNDVSFAYTRGSIEPVSAVDSVSMRIDRGELLLVVGATGSGKSTLMRLAAGLLAPGSGSVSLDGDAITPGSAGGRVGLIFQDPESQLFADTLLDDVAFGPRNLGFSPSESATRARDALADVGLDPESFGHRSPLSLSGGEARRAAIAGVLAMGPDYLLADEPTAGLDAGGRREVSRLLHEQRARAGVVVVSHAAEQFLGHADRLLVLDRGKVAWSGEASAAVSDPGILEACGIALPEVLEVQYRAQKCGMPLRSISVDASMAAETIIAATGGR